MSDVRLSPHDERRVAVVAAVDPRTVRSYLAGRSQHSTVVARVESALRELGLAIPPEPSGTNPPPPRAA